MNSTADKKTLLTRLANGAEGTTTFKSRLDSSYRFRLDAKQGKLRFWLEDRKSKQQWQTAELEPKDFVQRETEIPQATFEDYAVCFLKCLESSLPSDDFERELVPSEAKRDWWELRLTLKLRALMSTWTPTYRFLLEQVPLERVDLLAAKVRDQEEVIEQLQGKVHELSAQSPQYLRATTTTAVGSGQVMVWTCDQSMSSGDVIRVRSNGLIQIKAAGVFAVNLFVQNNNTNNSTTFEVRVNGIAVASCVDSANNSYQRMSPMSFIFPSKPNDEISVVYLGNNSAYANSSIVIYQLR